MQDDQTSLVRLETGDNDQKKRNVSGKYLRRDRSTEDYFPYISIQLDMFLQLED